jgi:hypothetical protein
MNQLLTYLEWQDMMEYRYDTMPPWWWKEKERREQYTLEQVSAITYQMKSLEKLDNNNE